MNLILNLYYSFHIYSIGFKHFNSTNMQMSSKTVPIIQNLTEALTIVQSMRGENLSLLIEYLQILFDLFISTAR